MKNITIIIEKDNRRYGYGFSISNTSSVSNLFSHLLKGCKIVSVTKRTSTLSA